MYIHESYFMMNSNPDQFHNYIDDVERMLSQERISEQSFQSLRESLENISKLYLEHKTESNDLQFFQTVMKVLTEYFQKDKNGAYKGDTQRVKSSRSAVNWLKNSYNIQHLMKNTEDASVSGSRVGTTSLSDYYILVDQNSISASKEGPNNREIQTLTSAEDKNDMQVSRKGDHGTLNVADDKNIDKSSKGNETKNGKDKHIKTEGEHFTAKMHSQLNNIETPIYIRKMEKEIGDLKRENKSNNQVIVDLNIKLTKKNLELESLNKEITDLRKKSVTEVSAKSMLQYKLELSQHEMQIQKDENNSLQSKLILRDNQLKKLELDIENRQFQETNKELQEFKTKSAQLQNNLQAKSDELISKLRELSECKSDLVRYVDNNGRLCNQLALLQKDYNDLGSKLKTNSTNYQKETTLLKDQLSSEKKAIAELCTQFETLRDDLKKQRDSYNKLDSDNNNLKNKFDGTLAELNEKNATNLKLEREIVDTGNKNSELNTKLEGVNFQLQEANKKLLSLQEEHEEVSNKLDQVQKSLETTKTNLNDYQNRYCEEHQKNIDFENVYKRHLERQNDKRNQLLILIKQRFRSQSMEVIEKTENALSQLDAIKSEVEDYRKDVHNLSGNKKHFLHLHELIRRSIEKIDPIQSQDISEVENMKRDLIKYCETVKMELQSKVTFA